MNSATASAAAFDLGLPDLARVRRREIGATLLRHFIAVWDEAAGASGLPILLRSAASNECAAARMRGILAAQIAPMLAPVAREGERAERAGLIATQVLGLALCRYVLKLPPVVAMSTERLIERLAPTLQRYACGAIV